MKEVAVREEIHRLIPAPQTARIEEKTAIKEVAARKRIYRARGRGKGMVRPERSSLRKRKGLTRFGSCKERVNQVWFKERKKKLSRFKQVHPVWFKNKKEGIWFDSSKEEGTWFGKEKNLSWFGHIKLAQSKKDRNT